jgi:hypothetical protein
MSDQDEVENPPPAEEVNNEEENKIANSSSNEEDYKHKLEDDPGAKEAAKKHKAEAPNSSGEILIPPSKEGLSVFNDNDVLSGRGGGTNVHPGNRNFRDLINLHRRAYLKARKNDKPAISRAIVKSVRDNGGRFLKKDEKTGLWFEVGDDAAREKTSQALRQRAPEMRKLLFDTEREEARMVAEEQIRQQRLMMGLPPDSAIAMQAHPMAFANPALFAAQMQKTSGMPTPEAYAQQAAAMGFMIPSMAAMRPPANFGFSNSSNPQQQQQQPSFTGNIQGI